MIEIERVNGKEQESVLQRITVTELLLYHTQGLNAVINDGKLIGFEQEEIPTQTANPSGDNK